MSDLPSRAIEFHEFCLLTAKPEELRSVIEILDSRFERTRGRRITDQVYKIPPESSGMTLFITTCVGMGHMNAAVRAAQIITLKQPKILIFLGTAASLKPHEVQVCDVVIPRKAVSRVYEKISEKGQHDYESRVIGGSFKEVFFDQNALISDTSTADCSPDALSAVASLPLGKISLENIPSGDISIGGELIKLREARIFDDIDIFSCGMVVDSVSYREFLTHLVDANMRKVAAIDMESYGFFKAIDATKNIGLGTACEGVMIRGISDYAGRKQQLETKPQGWKEKAVRNAALVAVELIIRLASA